MKTASYRGRHLSSLSVNLALFCLALSLPLCPARAHEGRGTPVAPDQPSSGGSISLDGAWLMKDYSQGVGVMKQVMKPGGRPTDCLPITVPGTVRAALLNDGEIPDPYYGYDNEKSLWVEAKEWWFFRTFAVDSTLRGKHVDLVFEGSSFQGEAYVNGERVGDLKGMLNPRSFDVSTVLNYGGENEIAVRLEATPDARINQMARGLTWDTPRDQLYSIAQCMYGWDWGPHGVPVGLWKPVRLRVSGPLRVQHPYVRTRIVSPSEAVCSVEVEVENMTDRGEEGTLSCTLVEEQGGRAAGDVTKSVKLSAREIRRVSFDMTVSHPRLWWPNGMGAQDLYRLNAEVSAGGSVSESASATFGIRELKLVENENVAAFLKSMKKEAGNPYHLGKVVASYPWTFQVNGKKMYAIGANWIPVDQLLRLDRGRYDRLLTLARDAHFNLLRVWGGGLYETDDFYDLCDRYGILAWQEFLSNRSFSRIDRDNFLEGAASAVYRLRNHPSLTFWCGGNEFDPDDTGSKEVIDALGELLAKLDPSREFHRASPYKGDDHHWGVWHVQEPYTTYRIVRPFRSEAGVNTFPVPEDYVRFTPKAEQWPLDTTFVEYHGEYNTGFMHVKKLMRYADEFGASVSADDVIKKSELYQALANSFNLEYCREHKYQNSGLLIWQYDDIWPCISWSMVDWYGAPKPSYYFQKRAASPVHVAADYERYLWKTGEKFRADVYLLNDTKAPVHDVTYVAKLFDIGSRVIATVTGAASVGPDASARIGKIEYTLPDSMAGKSLFVSVELAGSDGKEISDALYPIAVSRSGDMNEYRDIFADMSPMPEAAVKETWDGPHEFAGGLQRLTVNLTNPTQRIAYFVRLMLEGETTEYTTSYSDNFISLLPGETKSIDVTIVPKRSASPRGGLTFDVSAWNCPGNSVTIVP